VTRDPATAKFRQLVWSTFIVLRKIESARPAGVRVPNAYMK
jgi:hypothetical protein